MAAGAPSPGSSSARSSCPPWATPSWTRSTTPPYWTSPPGPLAFTTDSFVVSPPFFPGGDIGRLAVAGTVNDLAVTGARPRFLSCAFVLEEGLPLEDLRRVVESMARTAAEAGVTVVTGDTKVVGRAPPTGCSSPRPGLGRSGPTFHWAGDSPARETPCW